MIGATQVLDSNLISAWTATATQGGLASAKRLNGLGDSLFKENSAEGARTGVFEVTVTGRRVEGYRRWIPGRISNSQPAPLSGDDAAAELAYWQGLRACSGLAP